jgi:hypothetical protein
MGKKIFDHEGHEEHEVCFFMPFMIFMVNFGPVDFETGYLNGLLYRKITHSAIAFDWRNQRVML